MNRHLRGGIAEKEGPELRRLAFDEWPEAMHSAKLPPFEVWLSRRFLVQLFHEPAADRMTVNTVVWDLDDSRWVGGITWDELMACKTQCGRGDAWMVELYPPDDRVVDVANMRHLWLLDAEPKYAWRDEP